MATKFLKDYDLNKDGVVDEKELLRFLTEFCR
jgi:Ca2+-binding EF-hand superfamily protein